MTAHTLRGVVAVRPVLAGVVFSYPYTITDIITNVSDQPVDVPRISRQNRSWFTLKPGERVTVPMPLVAVDLPDQVWQLVGNRILSVSRLRNQQITDADATEADFVPLHSRPSLKARYDAERQVLIVWRLIDDITSQRITVNSLTPRVASATALSAIADVGQPAEFPIAITTSGVADFAFEISGRTHLGVQLRTQV